MGSGEEGISLRFSHIELISCSSPQSIMAELLERLDEFDALADKSPGLSAHQARRRETLF